MDYLLNLMYSIWQVCQARLLLGIGIECCQFRGLDQLLDPVLFSRTRSRQFWAQRRNSFSVDRVRYVWAFMVL